MSKKKKKRKLKIAYAAYPIKAGYAAGFYSPVKSASLLLEAEGRGGARRGAAGRGGARRGAALSSAARCGGVYSVLRVWSNPGTKDLKKMLSRKKAVM